MAGQWKSKHACLPAWPVEAFTICRWSIQVPADQHFRFCPLPSSSGYCNCGTTAATSLLYLTETTIALQATFSPIIARMQVFLLSRHSGNTGQSILLSTVDLIGTDRRGDPNSPEKTGYQSVTVDLPIFVFLLPLFTLRLFSLWLSLFPSLIPLGFLSFSPFSRNGLAPRSSQVATVPVLAAQADTQWYSTVLEK